MCIRDRYQLVTCTINGKKSEKMVDVRASLTDMLRNDYRLTSVKKGCEVGECGACTALINGEAINTCLYLAVWAEGKDIISLLYTSCVLWEKTVSEPMRIVPSSSMVTPRSSSSFWMEISSFPARRPSRTCTSTSVPPAMICASGCSMRS